MQAFKLNTLRHDERLEKIPDSILRKIEGMTEMLPAEHVKAGLCEQLKQQVEQLEDELRSVRANREVAGEKRVSQTKINSKAIGRIPENSEVPELTLSQRTDL